MTKSEQNKAHYEKNKEVLKEKARDRRVKAKKLKTFNELMEQLSDAQTREKARFLIENTPIELLRNTQTRQEVANCFERVVREENLTESETLQVRKNKRLVQRWQMFLKALEQHMQTVIDKRLEASK
ncbi:hypothetical protein VoSk93_39920 [Vibrio owensii]